MSIDEERELLLQNIPAIQESLFELKQKGLTREDVVVLLHARINKGVQFRSQKISKSVVAKVIRAIYKLEVDVRGSIV